MSISQQPLKQLEKPWQIPRRKRNDLGQLGNSLTLPDSCICMLHVSPQHLGRLLQPSTNFSEVISSCSHLGIMGTPAPPRLGPAPEINFVFNPSLSLGSVVRMPGITLPYPVGGSVNWCSNHRKQCGGFPQNTTDKRCQRGHGWLR